MVTLGVCWWFLMLGWLSSIPTWTFIDLVGRRQYLLQKVYSLKWLWNNENHKLSQVTLTYLITVLCWTCWWSFLFAILLLVGGYPNISKLFDPFAKDARFQPLPFGPRRFQPKLNVDPLVNRFFQDWLIGEYCCYPIYIAINPWNQSATGGWETALFLFPLEYIRVLDFR